MEIKLLCNEYRHLSLETNYEHFEPSMANGLLLSRSFLLSQRIAREYSLVLMMHISTLTKVVSIPHPFCFIDIRIFLDNKVWWIINILGCPEPLNFSPHETLTLWNIYISLKNLYLYCSTCTCMCPYFFHHYL